MLNLVIDKLHNHFKAVISPFIFPQKQVKFYKIDKSKNEKWYI